MYKLTAAAKDHSGAEIDISSEFGGEVEELDATYPSREAAEAAAETAQSYCREFYAGCTVEVVAA